MVSKNKITRSNLPELRDLYKKIVASNIFSYKGFNYGVLFKYTLTGSALNVEKYTFLRFIISFFYMLVQTIKDPFIRIFYKMPNKIPKKNICIISALGRRQFRKIDGEITHHSITPFINNPKIKPAFVVEIPYDTILSFKKINYHEPTIYLSKYKHHFAKEYFKTLPVLFRFIIKNKNNKIKNTLRLLSFLQNVGPHFIIQYDQFSQFLEKNKPKIILAGGSIARGTYGYLCAAKKNNAGYIELIHGYVPPKTTTGETIYESWIPYVLPDYVVLYNQQQKNFFLKQGWPEPIPVAMGAPKYDILAKKIYDRKLICKKYNLNSHKKIIIWGTAKAITQDYDRKEDKLTCQILFNYFYKNRDKYEFVIKLHPTEYQRAPLYKKWNKRYNNFAKIVKGDQDTFELLAVCDFLIIKLSTMWIEALLLNKPTICTEFMKSFDLSLISPFISIVRNKEELEKTIKNIQTKEFKEKFKTMRNEHLEKNYANFGHATDELIKLIRSELKEGV